MIVRTNGGQHIQIINQWDADEKVTKFRGRKVDYNGRSQSDLTPWFTDFNEAKEAALKMEAKGPFANKTVPNSD